jgi:hypothetical protein
MIPTCINPCFCDKAPSIQIPFVADSCFKTSGTRAKVQKEAKVSWVYLKGWTKNGFSKKKIMNQLKPIQDKQT